MTPGFDKTCYMFTVDDVKKFAVRAKGWVK